ncbi:MAG: hypothetical protein H6738_21475 [Alphaproteobacteria bacterium]|nr:hypothetical protein [Alphaproteobacteria bacterium]
MNAPRHLLRALTIACVGLGVLVPTLACTGTATPTPDKDAVEAPKAPGPERKIVGNWRMGQSEEEMRRLRVIDAAISKKPQKTERLGNLTPDEQKLYDEWKDKSGKEVRDMRQEIRYSKNSKFHFTDKQVSAEFGGDEAFKDIPYEVVSATDSQITVRFDPQLGNGTETHVITWKSDTSGVDDITAAEGKKFAPLEILRVK